MSTQLFDTTWIFAAGMRRSASTLQYLLAKELIELVGSHAAGWITHQKFDQTYRVLDGKHAFVVLKTHAFTPEFSATAKTLFEQKRAVALTIFRDPRDVAASLLNRNEFTQTWSNVMENMPVIMREFDLWANTYGTHSLVQSYNTQVLPMLREIASFLEILCGEEWMKACADRHSLEAHRKLIEDFSGEYDKENLLWNNHIDEGRTGRYKDELSSEQRHEIEQFYKAWRTKQKDAT